MIRNADLLRDFERDFIVRHPLTHGEALRLLDAMVEEAEALGVWPPADPWEGAERDVRVAGILCRASE